MRTRLTPEEKAYRNSPEGQAEARAKRLAYHKEYCKTYKRKKYPDPRTEANGRKRVLSPSSQERKRAWSLKYRKAQPAPTSEEQAKRRAADRAFREKNPDYQREYRLANIEKVREKERIQAKKFRANNPDYFKHRERIRKYGITEPEYDAMLSLQAGLCAICGGQPGKKALAVDHCHETGKVRSLLCANCNMMLGHAKDNVNRLYAAAAYLLGHK